VALNQRQLRHLRAAHAKLKALGHEDPESFALAKPTHGPGRADYVTIERILFELMALVRAELAGDHVHIGYTVLELSLFSAIRAGSLDPVADIVEALRERHLHEPGFLIYPLYGLGMLPEPNSSLLRSPGALDVIDADAGLAVTSGVGTREGLLDFLDRSASGLGIVGSVGRRDIDHYVSMQGVTDWLLSNPLLILRVRSVSMGPRENQGAYLKIISHRIALLCLVSSLGPPRGKSRLLSRSTHMVNNHETLDFKHYFVFETDGAANKPLRAERVPMGPRRAAFLRLADLPIDIDPSAWASGAVKEVVSSLTDAITDLEDLQAAVSAGVKSAGHKANVARKISTSLHWIRRSFASAADPREAVVAAAVAFEALLSDGFSHGITQTIISRAQICLDARSAPSELGGAVAELFNWRGAIVHKGEADSETSLAQAHQTYVYCLVEVVHRTWESTPNGTLEIADLLPAEAEPLNPAL
jgi:hypothetical protein